MIQLNLPTNKPPDEVAFLRPYGQKHAFIQGCKMKLTEDQVRELLEIKIERDALVKKLKAEFSFRQLSLRFGVHERTIEAVWKKKIWKHIT